jgi:glycerol uptake facilitator-like aquaporin
MSQNLLEGTEMKNVFAEFCGVLLFQFLGGAAAANSSLKGADSLGGLVTAALGNGIALAVCMYFTADVSGGHLNPAVTSALTVTGHQKGGFREWAFYLLAQIAGAIVGAGLLWLVLPMSLLTSHSYTTLGSMSLVHPMKVFIW